MKKPQRSDGGFPQRAATPEHCHLILDQFTRQAAAFSVSPHIKDEAALRLIVERSGAGPGDTVLDVACGAGHVVCAFAQVVRQATGIDITPAMLQRDARMQVASSCPPAGHDQRVWLSRGCQGFQTATDREHAADCTSSRPSVHLLAAPHP